MSKELLKKLQIGVVSLSAVALLAACGNDGVEEPPMDEDPAIEEPADEDPMDEEVDEEVDEEEDAS